MSIAEITAFLSAIAGLLTPIGVIVTAVVVILNLRAQKEIREAVERSTAQSASNSAKLDIVKSQNDGLVSRLEMARDASQLKAEAATADASMARAETVTAVAAGVAGVMEANRSHEKSREAIKEGAREAVEPHAKEGVAQGAHDAILEAHQLEELAKKTET